MVNPDFYAKLAIHLYFAIKTLKSDEVAPNIVIPDRYTKVDSHPYFANWTLKSDEFVPKHGYS